jgi:FlaA1/EpsC-like NDP-sugar epimerase
MTLFSNTYLAKKNKNLVMRFGSMMKPFATSAKTHRLIDLAIIVLTSALAIYLRLGHIPFEMLSGKGAAYFFTSILAASAFWRFSGLYKKAVVFANWRDLGIICVLALVAPLCGILVGFLIDRLDSIPRSVPLFHGTLLLFGLSGFRVMVLLFDSWSGHNARRKLQSRTDVLLVGHTDLAAVYAEAAQANKAHHIHIAGILTKEPLPIGTFITSTQVLGHPDKFQEVVRRLAVHGVHVSKLILLLPQKELGTDIQIAAKKQNIGVQNFYEALIPPEVQST